MLAEIELDSSTTRYYTNHDETVVFNGNSYLSLPCQVDNLNSNIKGEIPAIKVILSNLGNEALEVFETYDVLENNITIRMINLDTLSDTTAQDSADLIIVATSTSGPIATLVLGLPIGAREEIPRERFTNADFPGIPQDPTFFGI